MNFFHFGSGLITVYVLLYLNAGLMVSSHLKKQIKASEALKVQLPKHAWEFIGFVQPVLGLLAFYILNGSNILDRD
jgi:hypothetical protein